MKQRAKYLGQGHFVRTLWPRHTVAQLLYPATKVVGNQSLSPPGCSTVLTICSATVSYLFNYLFSNDFSRINYLNIC